MRIATLLGTYQSTLTDYKYIRKSWKTNAEEERLLGVSFTGLMDHKHLSGRMQWLRQDGTVPLPWTVYDDEAEFNHLTDTLRNLRNHAITTNKEWAEKLGIQPSAAITTVKPSGTVSQLVDSASGIHPRHAAHYIRTVRADSKDPLALFLKDAGVPCEVDVMNNNNLVFSFPQAAPPGSITRNELGAIEQLEHYLIFQKHWCEHNPSITVYVKEHEWLEVGAWVYKHLNDIGGVSFLPHSDHVYQQAPYQDITEEDYIRLSGNFPKIDWASFDKYEVDDSTVVMHELACVSGACEYV